MARIPVDRENRQGDPRNNRNAIVDRRQFMSQLFDSSGNPTATMYAFAGRMQKEVGAQGPEAQMAWAETVFNRCASRGHTIDYELRNHGNYNYWPAHQPEPGYSNNRQFIDTISKVCRNGTNLSLGATGNASESVGVGRETFRSRGERFGVETPDTRWWNTRFGNLIRGVGNFIGDVVGAIGQGIANVATGIANGARWVINRIGDALSPSSQPHPQAHPQPRQQTHPPEVPQRRPQIPTNYVQQSPPEPRVLTPHPPHVPLTIRRQSEAFPEQNAPASPAPHVTPRP